MKKEKRKSIKGQILALIAVPMAVIAIVVFIAGAAMITTMVNNSKFAMLGSAQNTVAFLLEDIGMQAEKTAEFLAEQPFTAQAMEGEQGAGASLLEQANQLLAFDYLLVLDNKGNVLFANEAKIAAGSSLQQSYLVEMALGGKIKHGVESLDFAPLVVSAAAPLPQNQGVLYLAKEISRDTFAAYTKELTGTEVAFSLGDVFVSSSSPGEFALTGANLSDKARDTVLSGTPVLIDTSVIAGQKFRANNLPLQGADGSIIGSYWVGIPGYNQLPLYALMMAMVLLVFGIALKVGSWRAKGFINPLQDLEKQANRMAQGEVDITIVPSRKDEIGALQQAFVNMVANLRSQTSAVGTLAQGDLTVDVSVRGPEDYLNQQLQQMILANRNFLGEIRGAADQVAASSGQISFAAESLAASSTEQAASVEEITSSLSTISQQTKTNADNSGKAYQLANKVGERMGQSEVLMRQMVKAMEEIRESSHAISKVNKAVEDIAFQTNILALNASVEAARAGAAGKGFAVVAEEVRNLAAKSAEASKETTALVESSIQRAESGAKIANTANQSLLLVAEETLHIVELLQKIDQASDNQTQEIQQLNISIEQVADITQTNAATSEESASSAQELFRMAQKLKDLVKEYKLEKSESLAIGVSGKRDAEPNAPLAYNGFNDSFQGNTAYGDDVIF